MTLSVTDGRKIVLQKQDSVGVNEALDDKEYLLNCFIDLGDLAQLKSFENKKCLLLGRTGAGKTALITKLQNDAPDKVILINPEALAMHYLSNSTIIRYLIELDIDLNTFFKLLWRHEICVEIFTKHVKAVSETDQRNFMEDIRYKFKKKNTKHLKALDYLEQWKDTFWKTSDSYVSKMITKKEDEVSASIGASAAVFRSKLLGRDKLSQEEITEIKQKGQSIVDDVQMKDVMGLLEMLDDFIEYHQVRYYVVIDGLDEKWAGDDIRHKLIKSLIETIRDLNRLQNIKPLATLRYDLLGRVFDISKDTGFQEEKYYPLYLDVKWSKYQLVDLLNERINYQFKHRYSKRTKLTYTDIFPNTVNGRNVMDYIIERTLMRPRDVIEFVNFCIEYATDDGDGLITEQVVVDAEKSYSKSRLSSLYYEWFADYPGLKNLVKVLKKRNALFSMCDIDSEAVKALCLAYATNPPGTDINAQDSILKLTIDVVENRLSVDDFLKHLIFVFYRVGLIGIAEPDGKVQWNKFISPKLDWDDFEENSDICIHPCYRSALKISETGAIL